MEINSKDAQIKQAEMKNSKDEFTRKYEESKASYEDKLTAINKRLL